MKTRILGITLFLITAGTIFYYPQLMARTITNDDPDIHHTVPAAAVVDVVFVLDTTGSMSGLIQTAKEKIWSIATTMASAQPTPEIRIGLVAYRDRGDAYVTQTVDLSDDLDSVYSRLMDFQADGGGDTPESVNQALYDAVHKMSWTKGRQAYQVIFLVGDAPPHMDYNEAQFPEIVAAAKEKGIVVNTIQCGNMPSTVAPWTQMANLGGGSFFQVEQAGSAVAVATPFDEEIATLSAKLYETRLYFGNREQKKRMLEKASATEKLTADSSVASRARRGVFNASEAGRTNMLGENELVDAVSTGAVRLDELDAEELPEALKPMAPAEQRAYVEELAEKRAKLKREIQVLAQNRSEYIAKEIDKDDSVESSLDRQLFDAVKEQADAAGLEYGDGPAY